MAQTLDESCLYVAAIDFGTTYSGFAFSFREMFNLKDTPMRAERNVSVDTQDVNCEPLKEYSDYVSSLGYGRPLYNKNIRQITERQLYMEYTNTIDGKRLKNARALSDHQHKDTTEDIVVLNPGDVNCEPLKEYSDYVSSLGYGRPLYNKNIRQITERQLYMEYTNTIDGKRLKNARALSDHQHKDTTEDIVVLNPGGRSSTGIKWVLNGYKVLRVTPTLALPGERIFTAACNNRDDYARLLSAPLIKMLLSIIWIQVTSVSFKISIRKIMEKNLASKQTKLKCQLCVDKNRATFWCDTCRKNICNFCKMYHEKVWAVINHDVQPLQ